MHTNKKSKGSSIERFENDKRNAKFKPHNRRNAQGRLTMLRSIRVDAQGNPRSKTWSYAGRR